ncbi:MAG: HAMP domain-containing protein [Streptosporangiales bacterium]|nr:HAMP domain-containing protein [Streptosporangiales bacterium]
MRRRLVVSTLVLSLVAVTVFGVPLAVAAYRLVHDETVRRLQRTADAIATSVQIRAERDERVTSSDIPKTQEDVRAIIRYPNGRVIRVGPRVSGAQLTAQARTTDGILVTVATPRAVVERTSILGVLVVAAIGVLAVGVTVGLAYLQARRLAWPLRDLAWRADRLGSGESLPARRHYGTAEVDRIAEVLDKSAARIAKLLQAERAFASEASHQLRTPLAALSMRLEEIESAANTPDVVQEEAQAALAQVSRLADVVEQLMAAARSGGDEVMEPVFVDDVVDQQRAEWEPAFRRGNRELRIAGDRGLRARVSASTLSQVIATLLDNALVHGDGTTTVRVSSTAQSVVVEVTDEGPGVPPGLGQQVFDKHVSGGHGTGLGLALARSLAEADGGRLLLARERPARFALFLRPIRDEPAPRRVVGGPA